MKLKSILLAIAAILTISSVSAQAKDNTKLTPRERKAWNMEMRQVKSDYLAKRLELTDAQREEFVTLYNEMDEKLRKLNDETRAIQNDVKEKGKAVSDLEYEKAAETLFEQKGRENEIELEYFKKFKTILTPRQLFELKDAEQDFTRQLMKQHRRVMKKHK